MTFSPEFPPPIGRIVTKETGYICTHEHSDESFAMTDDILYAVPVLIPYQTTIKTIGFRVDVAESGVKAVMGMYPIERGNIGSLILQTDEYTFPGSTGIKELNFSVALDPGLYGIVFVADSISTLELRGSVVNNPLLGAGMSGDVTHWIKSPHTYNAVLPAEIDIDIFIEKLSTNPTNSGICPRFYLLEDT